MIALSGKLLQWSILRNRVQMAIMILAVIGSLSSYVLLRTALDEMTNAAVQIQRSDWPFDLTVSGLQPEQQRVVSSINGIYYSETITETEVYFYAQIQKLIALPKEGSKSVVEMDSGHLPENEMEILISGDMALALQLELGDNVQFTGHSVSK
ncbi:MAG: hypothetical protein LLG09_03075 [Negativicutes bacterium]|nr:hypothetical protein [Negativicutes bacterium]